MGKVFLMLCFLARTLRQCVCVRESVCWCVRVRVCVCVCVCDMTQVCKDM